MTNVPPPPPGPTPGSATPPPTPPAAGSSKGLVGRVFDLSFSEFITPSIIKIIFVIGIVLSGLFALAILVSFAQAGGGGVVLGLILAPIVFAVYVLIARVIAEIYLLLFKIEENTRPR